MDLLNESAQHGNPPATRIGMDRARNLNETLTRVGAGDRDAFHHLYAETSSKLFGVCLRILRDYGVAEEVLQDFYCSVWRQADRFDPARASAMTWLTTMARNRAIDRRRQSRDTPFDEGAEDLLVDAAPNPAERAEQSDERRRLSGCIGELPPSHAGAIREAFYSGATYSELAERAEIPLGTMKSWIRRSLILLKKCLER